MFDEGGLARIAEDFDLGQAQLGGELAHFGLETGERLTSADDMTAQDMPDGDAEFARHRHGGPPEADCARAGRRRPGPTFAVGY